MSNAAAIERDPEWLPHRLDVHGRRVQFLRVSRAELAGDGFLADRVAATASDEAWLAFADVEAMEPVAGPVAFIFHSAFCRSTLLARALDAPGIIAPLNEPGIIAGLAGAGPAGERLVGPILNLLSRGHWPDEMVVIKPTNHANRLIPALLAARPDARAVLMTNSLDSFLRAVARKGMLGRRWARQLYLELMGYVGVDLGMDAREQFAMSDLQTAGLAWFLNQRMFAHIAGRLPARVRVLDGDRFDAERARTIDALGAFLAFDLPAGKADEMAAGPAFALDAKSGQDYATKAAADAARIASPTTEEELIKVGDWIASIARQAGIEIPARQTLF